MGITDDQSDPGLNEIGRDGMQRKYLVLSKEERAKGFVRPVRMGYTHLACMTMTVMNQAIAETYARDPKFYGGTYCAYCKGHFDLVNEHGSRSFIWSDTFSEPDGGLGVGE